MTEIPFFSLETNLAIARRSARANVAFPVLSPAGLYTRRKFVTSIIRFARDAFRILQLVYISGENILYCRMRLKIRECSLCLKIIIAQEKLARNRDIVTRDSNTKLKPEYPLKTSFNSRLR